MFCEQYGAPIKRIYEGSSLNDDLGGHFGMDGAKVGVGSGFREGVGEGIVGVERFGLEGGFVVADNGVGNVVAIGPLDRGTRSDGDARGRIGEVVDLDVDLG